MRPGVPGVWSFSFHESMNLALIYLYAHLFDVANVSLISYMVDHFLQYSHPGASDLDACSKVEP